MATYLQRILAGIAVLVLGALGVVSPVLAEETTTTTAPTTTTDGGGSESSTTTTTPTIPTTTTTQPDGQQSPTTTDPDQTTTSFDPLAEEGPAETVPQTEHTVPDDDGIVSSGRYSRQGEFTEAKVLWSSVREAEAKVDAARVDHQAAIARIKALRLREKELDEQRQGLDDDARQTIILLERYEAQLQERALSAFVRGGEAELAAGGDYDGVLDLQVKGTLIDSLLRVDRQTITTYEELRESLNVGAGQVFDRSVLITGLLADFEADVEEHRAAIEQAERELEAFEAGSAIYIEGVVFPIGDLQYEIPLIDSYGFPRMLGTEDEHWHEGIDIFAPMGAPLVATERGVVTRVGSGSLGGLRIWLLGESGTDWYYAHLSAFADGLHEGQIVEVGEVIGYVGTSGNAVGTPPHLHMQVHPGGGEPINPYPLLFVVSEREIRADAAERAEARRLVEEAQQAEEREALDQERDAAMSEALAMTSMSGLGG